MKYCVVFNKVLSIAMKLFLFSETITTHQLIHVFQKVCKLSLNKVVLFLKVNHSYQLGKLKLLILPVRHILKEGRELQQTLLETIFMQIFKKMILNFDFIKFHSIWLHKLSKDKLRQRCFQGRSTRKTIILRSALE